jgi:hypothetical protein
MPAVLFLAPAILPARLLARDRIDPASWVREVLAEGVRRPFCARRPGPRCRRGKTTTAAWAIPHAMTFRPHSLSVISCPAQRQSAEAVRRVREITQNGDGMTAERRPAGAASMLIYTIGRSHPTATRNLPKPYAAELWHVYAKPPFAGQVLPRAESRECRSRPFARTP